MVMMGNLCGQLRDSLSSAESGIKVRPLIAISLYRALNHLQPKFFLSFLDTLQTFMYTIPKRFPIMWNNIYF